jgi:polysaccharide pyruvyl transferase CsaB
VTARHPTLLLGGYYGHGNAGDEAILTALLGELRQRFPAVRLLVASGDPRRTAAEHGVDAISRVGLEELAGAVRTADAVVLGGGGVFQDYWPMPVERVLAPDTGGLPAYVALPVLAALAGKPSLLHAVGVGPLATEDGRYLTRAAFELSTEASVRDDTSRRELAACGLSPAALARVRVVGDPAAALEPLGGTALDALAERVGLAAGQRPLGVALRPWSFAPAAGEWEEEVRQALSDVLTADPAQVLLLLPFHPEEDLDVLTRLAEGLGGPPRVVLVRDALPPAALAGMVGRCRALLAMRYHAALFALVAGIPTVALDYDPKVGSLMAGAGMAAQALPPPAWRAPEIVVALERALPPAAEARARLRDGAGGIGGAVERALAAGSAVGDGERLVREVALSRALAAAGLASLLATRSAERDELAAALALARASAAAELATVREAARDAQERLVAAQEGLVAAQARSAEAEAVLVARAEEAARLRGELAAGAATVAELRQREPRWREQRDLLLAERNDLARRLDAFERTIAYGIASRFWKAMRRLLPEGSRRRALYRVARRALAPLAGRGAGVQPTAALDPPGASAPDPRSDLLAFEDAVRGSGARQVVAIFSATALVESEGQRPTQLALALAARGIPVVFVYWRWWDTEWRPQDRLEQGIVQIPIDVVAQRPEMVTGALGGLDRLALFEFPWPGFFETVAAANAAGWVTVYDGLDDWEEFHRVGQAVWYEAAFESHLVTTCDAVFAINEELARRLRGLGATAVEVVGNGFRPGLEVVREPRPLERGEVTVGYFGYLAGAWFDWELVAAAAARRPGWRFYLVGYGGEPDGVPLPPNLRLLGKQPQADLAAFAANWDVAIVPFKADRLASGADPIKTYEYLAMGLPVVTTGVYPPPGGEAFVRRVEGVEAFVAALAAAAGDRGDTAARRAFAASCTWDSRLDALLGSVAAGRQRVAEKRALAGTP